MRSSGAAAADEGPLRGAVSGLLGGAGGGGGLGLLLLLLLPFRCFLLLLPLAPLLRPLCFPLPVVAAAATAVRWRLHGFQRGASNQ